MDNQATGNKKRVRTIIFAVLIPVLLFSAIHFIVTTQIRRLLPTLVEKLSEGQYKLSYHKLKFEYFSPYMKLDQVKFASIKPGADVDYEVNVDSVYLSLESIIPLLINSAVSVKEIRLVNPSVIAKTNVAQKGDGRDIELHLQVSRMQENAMKFLNALSVGQCDIVNGSFRYFPFPGSMKDFNIEHVDLSIKDLVIPEYHTTNIEQIKAAIKLSINNPSLRIPDSLLDIQVDHFEWDNQEHYIDVGKFGISQHTTIARDSFSVLLDTIRIRNIDWPVWLDSGIIRLDTLLASQGNLYFESSGGKAGQKKNRDTVDLKKLKFWDAIGDLDIDHFAAHYISASVINTNPGRERNNSLIGDSLVIRQLSIRPNADKPILIAELGLGVREFQDKGNNNSFQSSFSHLQVKGNTMELNNYKITSTSHSKMGAGATLLIPSLFIEGISLDEIIDKKASIRQIRMESPELTLLKMPKSEGGKFSMAGANELKPYIDVERLVLNNAKVTVKSKTDTGVSMGTRQFSAVILTRSALKALTLDAFLSSFRDVNMKNFFFISPRTELQLFDGVVDYNRKSMRFGRIEGYLNRHKIKADLNNVTVVAADDLKPFSKDVIWHFKNIGVESGMINIKTDGNEEKKAESEDPNKLLGLIDSLSLRNIVVKFNSPKLEGSALVNSAFVLGHSVHPGFSEWERSRISADNIQIQGQGFTMKAKDADLNSSGMSTLNAAEIGVDKPGLKLNLSTSEVNLKGTFRSIDKEKLVFDQLSLVRPVINIALQKEQQTPAADSGGLKFVQVDKFSFDQPVINISLIRPDEKLDLVTGGETINGEELILDKEGTQTRFSFKNLRSELDGIRMNSQVKEIFKVGRVSAQISSFSKADSTPPVVSIKQFDIGTVDVGRIHNSDTMDIKTGGIKLGVVKNLVLQKDSILDAALKLPPVTVLPGSFRFNTAKSEIGIFNVEVDAERQFLKWDSLTIVNRTPRDIYFAQQPFEKDYITMSTGKVRADELKPVIFNKDTTVYIRKLSIDPLDFKVERDKRRPDDTVSYRPMLAGMFRKLKFPLRIDTIVLSNSVVWHNVIDDKTEKEGTIYFTEVNGNITNVRNFNVRSTDSIRIDLTSKLMSRGNMKFQYRQSYYDSIQGFVLGVRMGAMEMQELNRLMIPLNNIRVDRGQINELAMRVKGNDHFAFGSMDMNYNNLKVSVLNQENRKKGLISWLANIFVRGQNSKTGLIYTERLKNKSVFNFWSRIALNGLMTNLGVRKNGKQVRKFYKGLEKYELPPDLF